MGTGDTNWVALIFDLARIGRHAPDLRNDIVIQVLLVVN
jgi:hypothetical protein